MTKTTKMRRLNELNYLDNQCIMQYLQGEGRKPHFIQSHLWKYNYLITKIINMTWRKSHSMDSWHVLNFHNLEKALGRIKKGKEVREAYLPIREDLQRWGVLLFHPENYTTDEGKKRTRTIYKN